MKITIIAMGSRGDIQPYVALGKGLKRIGHEVHMPVPEVFKQMVLDAGLIYTPVDGIDPQAFLRKSDLMEARSKSSESGFLIKMFKDMRSLMDLYYNQVWEACKNSDAIISAFLYLSAYDCAEKLGIPCIQSLLYPLYPTDEFPPIMIPPLKIKFFNRFLHILLGLGSWVLFRKNVNSFRKKVLNLKPYGFFGPFKKFGKDKFPVLFAYSSKIIPKPHDWLEKWKITGYWFNDDYEDFNPPDDLVDFINNGTKPVYIGFGSMTHENPEEKTKMIIDALKLSGQRGIISTGWAGFGNIELPDSVFLVNDIPHSWLFKNVAATVIHGGAGTTAASIRAGVPTIITPFLGDQFFWGRRVFELGVGPKPIMFTKLTAESLSKLIISAVTDEDMKLKAKDLGEKVNNENGVEEASNIIDSYVKSYYDKKKSIEVLKFSKVQRI